MNTSLTHFILGSVGMAALSAFSDAGHDGIGLACSVIFAVISSYIARKG